jgi:uncharacterized membrane protein (DUF2068 family)
MSTHEDFIIREITKELNILFSTFDTKVLATAMMIQSARALRSLHTAGVWTVKDVKDVLAVATENILLPFPPDQIPEVRTINNSPPQ